MMIRLNGKAALITILAVCLLGGYASAEYNRKTASAIDLDIFKIDQKTFLGSRLNGDYRLIDEAGKEFPLRDMIGKPLILVLSYFKCDGVCSTVNADLKELLLKRDRVKIGEDYNVLTVSFDQYDTSETIGMFTKELGLTEEMAKGWTLARMKDPKDIKKLTKGIGFKYFWSPQDRMFFHPNVYIFISPKGRVARYLYASTIGSKDIELALLETGQEQIKPSKVINLLVSYCYSYNFKEGKYTYNIPLFIAVGSLTVGVTSFIVSAIVFNVRRNKKKGEIA